MRNKAYIITFIVAFPLLGLAQKEQKLSLHDFLKELEEKYEIKFSYADQKIKGFFIENDTACKTISSCLELIETSLPIKVVQVNERFYTIILPKESMVEWCILIQDELNGRPIADVHLIAENQSFLSSNSGRINLNSNQVGEKLLLSRMGYKSQIIYAKDLNAPNCNTVYLSPQTKILEEVLVKNYLVKGFDKKMDGSFSFDPQELSITPGLMEPDILHTLQILPGIQSIDESVSNINVRGGTNDQNLVLWEGTKMYQTGHFFGLISAFNPYIIEEVNLIKNGTSPSLFEGVSSVIQINTDNEVNNALKVNSGVNLLNTDLSLKIPLHKKIALHLSGRRTYSEVVNSPTFEKYFDRAFADTEVGELSNSSGTLAQDKAFGFYDYSAKLLYDINDKNKLRISFLDIFNEIRFIESGLVDGKIDSKESSLSQDNKVLSASYIKSWSDKVSTKILGTVSNYNLNSLNYDILNDQRLSQENDVLDLGLKIQSNWQINKQLKQLLGYEFKEIGIQNADRLNNPNFFRSVKEVIRVNSLFTDMAFSAFGGETVGNIGIRLNHLDKFNFFNLEPRLSFNQALTKHISLELLAEMKSQVTTQIIDFQSDFLGVEQRRWVLVDNEEIPILKSRQISLGVLYNKNKWLISLEGYLKKVDGIYSASQGFQNQFQNVRTAGSYRSAGGDLLIKKGGDKWNGWVSYSFSYNIFDFYELAPNIFPNNLDIRQTTTAGFSYTLEGLELSTGINFHTGRPITLVDSNEPVSNSSINFLSPNAARLSSYFRPDLSVKYNFNFTKKLRGQLGGSLWNYANRDNLINTFFKLDNRDNLVRVEESALKITPNLMLRILFNGD